MLKAGVIQPMPISFDSYPTLDEALFAANRVARQLSERDTVAASMTSGQASEYAVAAQTLNPLGVSLNAAVSTMAEAVKIAGDLPSVLTACKFYIARHKKTVQKPVAEVVEELLTVKKTQGASDRYLQDLHLRLNRFATAFPKSTCNVTTADVQTWMDGMKILTQNYMNFRTVVHTFFKFAVARGYAVDNPVAKVEKVKVRHGDTEIFTPMEIARLIAAAPVDFIPCLTVGAFAGLRSAEIERIEWSDIDLKGRHITIGANKAKTASRRVVPIADNLVAWLSPYAKRNGKIWPSTHDEFYKLQQATAAATEVKADPKKGTPALPAVRWKANGLRHSYASYRFALTNDAGRVAGELGNTASVVHRHYRELVKPYEARSWFNVKPQTSDNIVMLPVGKSLHS
jgi:integrase